MEKQNFSIIFGLLPDGVNRVDLNIHNIWYVEYDFPFDLEMKS